MQTFYTDDGSRITYHGHGNGGGPWLIVAAMVTASVLGAVNAISKGIASIRLPSVAIQTPSFVGVLAGAAIALGILLIIAGMIIAYQILKNKKEEVESPSVPVKQSEPAPPQARPAKIIHMKKVS